MQFIDFIQQVFSGKTPARILFNRAVTEECSGLTGNVLDLAGSRTYSYHACLPSSITITTANVLRDSGVDVQIDFNQPLPIPDSSYDAILCFHALYIAVDRIAVLRECHRVLKPGGRVFLSLPFAANEMPEPADYCRLSYQGIEREARLAGFKSIHIRRLGDRCTVAMQALHPVIHFHFIRLFAYAAALGVDRIYQNLSGGQHPFPVEYFVRLTKDPVAD